MPHRLGKKPPRIDSRTLRLAKYLPTTLPAPPASCALYTDVTAGWPMDGNDQYGDCTMAGAAHMIEEWTAQTVVGTPTEIPSAEIVADYLQLTGGPDTGLDLLTVLNWWRQTGFAAGSGSDRISAYAEIALANQSELEQAVYLFGGAYLGVSLPDYAVQGAPDGNLLGVDWTAVPPGGFAANPPDQNNGHCICAVGYDSDNVYVVTWGAVKAMSWGFYSAYADEAFAVLSPDWLVKGVAPPGVDLAQLQQDLFQIGSAPAPTPPPVPDPPPTPPASCASLLDAAEAQLLQGHILPGIVGLFGYIECVVGGGAAAAPERHRVFIERVRRSV